ncbi:phenylacetate--CoA ligase family protein [Faecalibacter rhinopitheci]|uniref:Phenylacetate--CoA ligase family protein n=1 Tax=Faecalibacter rhinopitheci TaxID=2779678 RepID=A0A8J7KIT0_9FLAO|nr:phenylacetate--CoA ligase family protein [Faecalibacter rhinopitheci]MBF0598341.1 phenylacetate--CoA ligase family protein [Faecalibacter rhinopitheci]
MKDKIYKLLPHFLQCLLITLFNYFAYKDRYGNKYQFYLNQFKQNRNLSLQELKNIQTKRFNKFLSETIEKSSFYRNYPIVELNEIEKLPIVNKETLRKYIGEVYAITKSEGILSKTGGTTGKSLEVYFTKENMQERFAMLDDFRNRTGYKLGEKTAWFSGKNLLTNKDLKKNRFWKTDFLYKVRYYSTFHIKDDYLKYYVEDLIQYQPKYFVGFPSTILEIAKYGLKNGYDFPANTVKAIFPTAETITQEMRVIIEKFFKTRMYNQYASSEGAPFIIECEKGNLHLELQSGVFEVLDDNNKPTNSGKLVITSFTTEGTPLIRYDIGDSITLEDSSSRCTCGNHNPLIKEILGRIDDYIYSLENGKINLGNVSNTLKDTRGIVKFQAIQNELNALEIHLIVDDEIYNNEIEKKFIQNWKDRVGNQMKITIIKVKEIPIENSGKFRIVKNNIKHLI